MALGNKYELIGTLEILDEKSHASKLTVLIEQLLYDKNIDIQSINGVAISKGPGSYTGLRIGASVVKGICYRLNIPVISINTLQILCMGFIQSGFLRKNKIENPLLLCPMIDAKRMEVYRAFYNNYAQPVSEIKSEIIHGESFKDELQINKILIFGSGAEKCKSLIQNPNIFFADGYRPLASYMISLAYDAFLQRKFEDCAYFEPYYLKDFVPTINKKIKRFTKIL